LQLQFRLAPHQWSGGEQEAKGDLEMPQRGSIPPPSTASMVALTRPDTPERLEIMISVSPAERPRRDSVLRGARPLDGRFRISWEVSWEFPAISHNFAHQNKPLTRGFRAGEETRTPNLLFTRQLRYRLRHASTTAICPRRAAPSRSV
jgi:hypothetical protein